MSKPTLIIIAIEFLLIAQSFTVSNGIKAQVAQTNERDLSRYDRIGAFNVPVGTNPNNVSTKIRGFIWEHWEQRRLGYAVATFHSKEGEPSTSYMFVEPDENGVWHISVRIERNLIDRRGWSDPKYKGKMFRQTDNYMAYALERVSDKSDSYHLRFRDKEGRIIMEW